MDFTITIPDATCTALEKRLAEFKTEVAGANPGEVLVKPMFGVPAIPTWLTQIIGNNVAQLVPPEQDAEAQQLQAAIEDLRRQHAEKLNKIRVSKGN